MSQFQAGFKKLASHKLFNFIFITLSCLLVAYLDFLSPPEVPIDALYAFPIWWGLVTFGVVGEIVTACSSIILFCLSNYVITGNDNPHLVLSVVLTGLLMLLFSYGAYHYRLNQQRLSQASQSLQYRLEELDRLNRQAALLHERTLKLAVMDERNRIAREIHDVLAQGLAGIILQVEAAHLQLNDLENLKERLDQIDRLARTNLQEARRSVANLRPLPLDSGSLVEALKHRVETFLIEKGIPTSFSFSGEARLLPGDIETTLYRVAQEALNNAAYHSGASQIEVSLDYDEEEVCLTVQDNGKGFDSSQRNFSQEERPRFGLHTMQERARLCGGWVTIQTAPGEGCRVRAIIPYPHSKVMTPLIEELEQSESDSNIKA